MLRDSVDLQEKTLAIVKARFESGLSPELDVRRAETSVETLRASIAPLEQALRRSMHQLAALAGQFPGAYDSLLTPVGDLPRYSLGIPARLPLQNQFHQFQLPAPALTTTKPTPVLRAPVLR